MSEIILASAKCAECGKELPVVSVAVVIDEDFIVCVECHEKTEADWRDFLELKRTSGEF